MTETVFKTNVKREKGFLYFCGTDDEGNIVVCRTKMARGRKKKN